MSEFDPISDGLPSLYVDGKFNPAYLYAKTKAITDLMHRAAVGKCELPKGFNAAQALELLKFEAKLYKIDENDLIDGRSDAEKFADEISKLMEAPEALWETLDHDLDVMEAEFETAIKQSKMLMDSRRPEMTHDQEIERDKRRGKSMLSRIRRVRRLRDWVRVTQGKVPKGESVTKVAVFEAAKPLLFMLYVSRSNMTGELRPGSASKVYRVGHHHARFAVDTWEARNGIVYTEDGIVRGKNPFKGVQLIAPPGHGKTDFVMNYTALEISLRPHTQGVYLHAKADKAKEHLQHIADMFGPNSQAGRRRNALYPGLELADRNNNSGSLRLDVDGIKSPTLQATGVTSAGLGGNTNFQVWDDVVPQSDRDQEAERDRRFNILNGTWLTRQRGKETFVIFTGYFFHRNDAMARFAKLSGDTPIFLVSRQACGGPNSTPAFKALWPEVYPANELRLRFEQMNRNMDLWSANYMADPISDETRRVRRLRYYQQGSSEHTQFLENARFYVTVDPTATNRETSDQAGLIYLALGEVYETDPRSGQRTYQTRCRIIDAAQLHLNQVELCDHVASYARQRPVYEVHVETRSAFSATADLFQRLYDLEVVRHDPTNKSKDIRLKSCAGVIDDSSADFRALVEFPGVLMGEKIICDPRYTWLAEQFLDFGVCGQDHCVDALTQIVNHFLRTGELDPGSAMASETIKKSDDAFVDKRIEAYLKQFENGPSKLRPEQEDALWLMRGRRVETYDLWN